MKFFYSSPNFYLKVLLKTIFLSVKEAESRLINYFRSLTGKEYILLTNSCRSALFLTYRAIGDTGEVITSPLTCKVAIDPIVEAGFIPVFADIRLSDLNIDPHAIEEKVNPKTKAIQIIHIGGVSCDMTNILKVAKKYHLPVIEDCAQSLGASFNGKPCGFYGDISCFTLTKNAYGIGGGILATNNYEIYSRARELYAQFSNSPDYLIAWRITRNLLFTMRRTTIGKLLYNLMVGLRGGKRLYTNVRNQLFKISDLEQKIAAIQLLKYSKLHQKRKTIGKLYYSILNNHGILHNNDYPYENSSFTKFFVFNPLISSQHLIPKMLDLGIEVRHLEDKIGSPVQEYLIDPNSAKNNNLSNYLKVHNAVISLPLCEYFTEREIIEICKNLINEVKSCSINL